MSGDVVNLRQFRKQKARSDKEKAAEQNRITFGRTWWEWQVPDSEMPATFTQCRELADSAG